MAALAGEPHQSGWDGNMGNLEEYLKGLTPARDRRLKMRVTPTSPVYVMFGDTSGSVVNITETGMAIAVGYPPAVGDYLIRIRFQLPMSSQSVEVSARIVWLTESKKVVGVRLVDLTADARAQISDWIASEKLAAEFEQPAQLLPHNKQPLEISSRKSRRIFSNPSVRDEEAAAHYAEMFPSEKIYAKHPIPVDKNKPQQDPFPTPVRSNTDPGDSMLRAAAKISTGDLPQTLSLPQVQTASDLVAPSASNTPVAGIGWQARTDEVKSSADGAGDSASHPYIFDLSGLQVAALVFLFAVIGLIIGIAATKASVDVLASLGRGPFRKQVRLHSQSPQTQPPSGLRSDSAPSVSPTETSSAQTSRSSVDLDSSAGANTVGSFRPPEEKAKQGTRDSEPSVKVPSTDSNSSTTVELKPSADPDRRPNRNDLKELIARSLPPPVTAEHAHSTVAVGPSRSARRNRALLSAKPATGTAPKSSLPAASPKRPDLAVVVGPRGTAPGNPASHTAKPAAAEVPKPSVVGTKHNHPAVGAGPKGTVPGNPASDSAKSAATAAPRSSPPPASPKPKNPAVAGGPKDAAPGSPAPPMAKPPTAAQPNPPPPAGSEPAPPTVAGGPKDAAPGSPAPPMAKPPTAAQPNPPPAGYLVTLPSEGSKPLKLVFPQRQIAFSPSLLITTQLSVLVPPESGPAAAQPSRLQAGKLVSYVLPRNPRPGDRYGAEETVKVHATIGQQGLVTEVRPMSGPIFLLSSTMGAVHLWRYKPTLLNGTPIETHQDVTIIFKLPR
jgi:hypothetical protein